MILLDEFNAYAASTFSFSKFTAKLKAFIYAFITIEFSRGCSLIHLFMRCRLSCASRILEGALYFYYFICEDSLTPLPFQLLCDFIFAGLLIYRNTFVAFLSDWPFIVVLTCISYTIESAALLDYFSQQLSLIYKVYLMRHFLISFYNIRAARCKRSIYYLFILFSSFIGFVRRSIDFLIYFSGLKALLSLKPLSCFLSAAALINCFMILERFLYRSTAGPRLMATSSRCFAASASRHFWVILHALFISPTSFRTLHAFTDVRLTFAAMSYRISLAFIAIHGAAASTIFRDGCASLLRFSV